MQQTDALNLLKLGKNVFLTGAAGAGKTYLLNQYINYLKEHDVKVAITASTGIAATHLQGSTIHSWSGIGIRDFISSKDLEKLAASQRVKRNYKNTKVLIIDEISMLHKHQLDMVDHAARFMLDKDEPFGGIQLVVCGDFFQLPPVSSANNSKSQFAFESTAWEKGDFHVCYLNEQHRQGNDPLLAVLNDIRSGTAGEHTKVPLRTRYKKEPHGTCRATKLYSRNINVDVINSQELANIKGEEKSYTMSTSGWDALVDGLKKSCLAMEYLKLKVGAEVMFIKNDTMGHYVNGTRGVVIDFNSEDWPIVKTYDNRIITAYPAEWNFEDNGVVRASLSQVPLRLAWAITIHKSQGMTLDAAEMDLGDVFEPGMGYVALSRVRSLNGLKLLNLNEMALKVNPKILLQDEVFKDYSEDALNYLKSLSEKELEEAQNQTLIMRFGGCKQEPGTENSAKSERTRRERRKEKPVPTHLQTLQLLKENLSIADIAEKRGCTIGTIIGHIEKLQGLKQLGSSYISHLRDILPQNDFDLILAEFNNSEDGKLMPIYEKFNGKYSFDDIKIVRLFANKELNATSNLNKEPLHFTA